MAVIGGIAFLFFGGQILESVLSKVNPQQGGGGGGGGMSLDLSGLFSGLSLGGGSLGNLAGGLGDLTGLTDLTKQITDLTGAFNKGLTTGEGGGVDLSGLWDVLNGLKDTMTGLTGLTGLGGGGGGGGGDKPTPDATTTAHDVWVARMNAGGQMVSDIGKGAATVAIAGAGSYAAVKVINAATPGLKTLLTGGGKGVGAAISGGGTGAGEVSEAGGGLIARALKWGTGKISKGGGSPGTINMLTGIATSPTVLNKVYGGLAPYIPGQQLPPVGQQMAYLIKQRGWSFTSSEQGYVTAVYNPATGERYYASKQQTITEKRGGFLGIGWKGFTIPSELTYAKPGPTAPALPPVTQAQLKDLASVAPSTATWLALQGNVK